MGTMLGVFTTEKLKEYLDETEVIQEYLKVARKNFPEQEDVYQNIRTILNIQSTATRFVLSSK
jgi:hypothetical protein